MVKSGEHGMAKLMSANYKNSRHETNEAQVKNAEEVKKPFVIIRDARRNVPSFIADNNRSPIQSIQVQANSQSNVFPELIFPNLVYWNHLYSSISFGRFQWDDSVQYMLPYVDTVAGTRRLVLPQVPIS